MPEDLFKQFRTSGFMKVMNKTFDTIAKTKKATWKAMGTAVKAVKTATDLLSVFGSTSLIAKVFDKVISNYTTYLSNIFWGEVVEGIDFDIMTTAITDVIGPIFQGIGEWIGDRIEEAPVGTVIGGSLGYLIGSFVGHPGIGAAIGASLGYLINSYTNVVGAVTAPDPTELRTTVATMYGRNPDFNIMYQFFKKNTRWTNVLKGFGIDSAEDLKNWFLSGLPPPPPSQVYLGGALTLGPPPDYGANIPGGVWGLPPDYGGIMGPIMPYGSYQFGGTIPKTGPYLLHKNEEVISANKRDRGGITINIDLKNAIVVENYDRFVHKLVEQVMMKIG